MNKRQIFRLASLVTIVAAGLILGPAASAVLDTSAVTSKMIELGISSEDRASILVALNSGNLPLSDTMNSIPVSTVTILSGAFEIETQRFADGSVKRISRELPQNRFSRSTGLNACSVSSGTGYQNYVGCTVFNDTPLVTMGFIADFTLVQGAYNDYISKAVNGIANCRLGTCSNAKAWVGKSIETSSGKAWAKMTADYAFYGGAGSSSYSLLLTVGGNSYQLAG